VLSILAKKNINQHILYDAKPINMCFALVAKTDGYIIFHQEAESCYRRRNLARAGAEEVRPGG
jgi:hypothetical protein